ncbi:chaperonin 10-like protein [Triangularia verruculosa]|uniref:Chaperonin 10-like protein n=1 Tax=Triangularia verruculosa TaxID=2587418 RepID=A0AAN6XRT0_9PEZI|nr:chaperonin 10-like protein [Triangularia verruculosa]
MKTGPTFPIETTALLVPSPGSPFTITPVQIQNLRPNELLIEIQYSGLCHTDFLLRTGHLPNVTYPCIPGHEGAGKILAIGPAVKDRSLQIGDNVLLSFTSCDDCHHCLKQSPTTKCKLMPPLNLGCVRHDGTAAYKLSDGTPVSGHFFGQSSFAKIAVVHELSVVKTQLTEEEMALYAPMGCGYQTGAGTIMEVLKPEKGDTVVVFGMGSVGFAALMAAALILGVETVIAVDLVQEKLNLAREFGAACTINGGDTTDVVAEIMKITGGKGVDFAVDTTGVGKVVQDMIACLGQGGTAASVGAPPPGVKIEVDAGMFFAMSKKWIGVVEGEVWPAEFIPRLIQAHREGKFPVERISKVYSVVDVEKAIADMETGKVCD